MTWKRLASNRELWLGLAIVLAFVLVAAAAPLIAPPSGEDPYQLPKDGYVGVPQPPNEKHPLGTMQDQYDVFYGLIWGTRVAFRVGLIITLGRLILGVTVGLISGYLGGWVDALLMRITDAFMSFPVVAGVFVMLSASTDWVGLQLGEGDRPILLGLIIFGWMQYARLIRANVLAERGKEYVTAAESIGAKGRRIVFRHILPNANQGLLVLAASDVGAMVIFVAALTFLGLAGNEAVADWGMMMKLSRHWVVSAQSQAFAYWYTYIPPIVAILLFSIGWNLIGDSLRDVLDPRLRSTH